MVLVVEVVGRSVDKMGLTEGTRCYVSLNLIERMDGGGGTRDGREGAKVRKGLTETNNT